MRLLLTRPVSGDDPLEPMLKAGGHEILHEPLLTIEQLPLAGLDLSKLQAVAVTSSNALRGLTPSPELRALPLFAVGEATARLAVAKGFATAVAGNTGAQDLASLVARQLQPDHGGILYLRGAEVAFDLEAALTSAGFYVDTRIVYRAAPVKTLSFGVRDALVAGTVNGVVLLSPRTSEVYQRLAAQARVFEAANPPLHFCLSQRVAAPLADVGQRLIRVPARPNLQELVALIGIEATQSSSLA